ncbi:MAG: thioredoxin family protein [Schleiferiaceae bacterium]|nr:thioredoxin family protein [Schleiferiaceae bacterium]
MELLVFHSTHCGPCNVMVNYLKAYTPPGGITLRLINTDDHPAAAIDYQIKGVPYLILKNDKRLWEQFGFVLPERLTLLLTEQLQKQEGLL